MAIETVDAEEVEAGKLFGSAVKRREDPALLTGDARYGDDIQRPRMAYMAVLRSRYAHAILTDVGTSAAEALDGVLAVYTQADIDASDSPGHVPSRLTPPYATIPDRPLLARKKVRFQGDPIAVVVAEDRYRAHEALDLIEVAYDRLEAVTTPAEATAEDAPTLHEEAPDNYSLRFDFGDEAATEEALSAAEHVTSLELVNQRIIPTALEPRVAVSEYRASTGDLDVAIATQDPHAHRLYFSETLGLPDHKVHVDAPDVGGAFGSKGHNHPAEALTGWCAMQLGRPVKWQARRSEGFQSTYQGRDHRMTAEVGVDDGLIVALRVHSDLNMGAYVGTGMAGLVPVVLRMLSGQYDIPVISAHVDGVFTNTTPLDAYRGAGRPEAAYVVERIVSAAAKAIGEDPAEFRRRNFIGPGDFPKEVATGHVYDSGDYERTLDMALEHVDYADFRERQREARKEGRYLGIGLSCYVEACAPPIFFESGLVRFHRTGTVTVQSGTFDHGQGHHTTFAQIAADELGVDYDDVEVVQGNTDEVPEGNGTMGSRSAAVGGTAIKQAVGKVIDKARPVAAHQLEAPEEDMEFVDGEFRVTGAPGRAVHIQDVARAIYAGEDVPPGAEVGLEASAFYTPEDYVYPFGTHVAVVEVDPETGEIEFERYVGVDDCGNQINPKIVEGQIHGGIAQGIGQALYEGAVYDENGNLATGSLQDYAIPKAFDVPEIELDETETPSPSNPLGVKGVGEAGTIAAPQAVVNAVVDALEPLEVGPGDLDMPLDSESVWRAISSARSES